MLKPFHFLQDNIARRPTVIYGIALAMIVLISFAPALRGEFLNWDDNYHVFLNRHITSLGFSNIRGIFLSSINGTYIPLTILSFAFEYKLFNLNPAFYHFDNLLLHLLTVVLIFRLGLNLRLSAPAAFMAAVIFAIHPIHVESVVWVTERKDVLYALFFVSSLQCYFHYVRTQKGGWYILSLLAGGLSVLAKPMALSLPWILILMDWFLQRRWSWRIILEKIPFVLAIEPIAWITYTLNARAIPLNPHYSFFIWVWSFTFYIEKFLVPMNLMPIYWLPYPLSLANPAYLKAVVIFVLFSAAVVFLRKNRWFMFAVLFFVGSSFFLWRYDYSDVSVVADRFMYLPSLGFCFLSGLVIETVWRRFSSVKAVSFWKMALPVILLLGMLTFKQTLIWQRDMTFWDTFFSKHPNKILAYSHISSAMVRHRQYDMALDYCNKLLKLYPDVGEIYNNRGIIYQVMKAYGLAMADFNKAIELNPSSARSYNNRGCLYRLMGNYDLALKDIDRAIELDPKYGRAYYNKGFILSVRQDYRGALAFFDKALALDPMITEAYNARGFIYNLSEDYQRALENHIKALIIDPKNIFAMSQLADIFLKTKQYAKALAVYDSILHLSPDNAPAFFERSLVYRDMGKYSDALMDAWKARSLGYAVNETYIQTLETDAGEFRPLTLLRPAA
jgi:tetratricopeptide (TPR) repeat protein